MSPVGFAETAVMLEGGPLGGLADARARSQVEATIMRLMALPESPVWRELLLAQTIATHSPPDVQRSLVRQIKEMAAWDAALAQPAGESERHRSDSAALAGSRVTALRPAFEQMVQGLAGYAVVLDLLAGLQRDNYLLVLDQPDALSMLRAWVERGPYYGSFVDSC